ncbi:Kinase, NEK [Giardia lamblia P15]|uniref:non-specific serine/threonine protein kinase n=1 Tax=Giardia intestinalis (strain P15) TaxID=658858 RepID=E1EVR6_GIAIA|nr:Kinase, NEK [Giardia lamblia P15]
MRERLHSQFHTNSVYIRSSQLGAVYKAERLSDGAIVAVKEISLRNIPDDQYVALCRPYELSRYLTHPHLLVYHEAYVIPGERCLLEMELCENGALVDVLDDLYKRKEHLEESFVWEIIAQIADALVYLHDVDKPQGSVLHKAVRASSVFIGENGLKLAKLGSTRHASELTVFGTRRKHDMYLPPEATGRRSPTDKWDIWGLGCLVVEVCTLGTVYNDSSAMLSRLSFDLRSYSDALAFMVASCLSMCDKDRPSAVEIKGHIEIRRALRRVNPSSVTKICNPELRAPNKHRSEDNSLQGEYEVEAEAYDAGSDHSINTSLLNVGDGAVKTSPDEVNQSSQVDPTLSRGCMYNGLISDDLMELILSDNSHGVSAQMDRLMSCLKTALDVAAFESRPNVLQVICEMIYTNALPIQISKRKGERSLGKTPLMFAAEIGNKEKIIQHLDKIMQLFYTSLPSRSDAQGVHHGANDDRYTDEVTALMIAASANKVEAVKLLLLEIGVQNQNGMTALMFAAMNNSAEAAKYLVAEAGFKTVEGKTALMLAVHNNAMECVEILKGREGHIADKAGNRAIDYVRAPGTKVPLYHQERMVSILSN